MAYYGRDGRLRREDGVCTVDEVWQRVLQAINRLRAGRGEGDEQ